MSFLTSVVLLQWRNMTTLFKALSRCYVTLHRQRWVDHKSIRKIIVIPSLLYTPHFLPFAFSTFAFSTLRIFNTPHFLHSTISTLVKFQIPHFLHSSFLHSANSEVRALSICAKYYIGKGFLSCPKIRWVHCSWPIVVTFCCRSCVARAEEICASWKVSKKF